MLLVVLSGGSLINKISLSGQRLAPEWKNAAAQLKGKVKVGSVDATVEQTLAQRYGVSFLLVSFQAQVLFGA